MFIENKIRLRLGLSAYNYTPIANMDYSNFRFAEVQANVCSRPTASGTAQKMV